MSAETLVDIPSEAPVSGAASSERSEPGSPSHEQPASPEVPADSDGGEPQIELPEDAAHARVTTERGAVASPAAGALAELTLPVLQRLADQDGPAAYGSAEEAPDRALAERVGEASTGPVPGHRAEWGAGPAELPLPSLGVQRVTEAPTWQLPVERAATPALAASPPVTALSERLPALQVVTLQRPSAGSTQSQPPGLQRVTAPEAAVNATVIEPPAPLDITPLEVRSASPTAGRSAADAVSLQKVDVPEVGGNSLGSQALSQAALPGLPTDQASGLTEALDEPQPTEAAAELGTSQMAPPPTASRAAASAPSAESSAQIDELARRLFDPLMLQLRAELLVDRERRGLRTDTW